MADPRNKVTISAADKLVGGSTRVLRLKLGISDDAMMRQLACNNLYLVSLEQEMVRPTPTVLFDLADFLGCKLSALFEPGISDAKLEDYLTVVTP